MNWIFEIYGDTYKALTLQGSRRKPARKEHESENTRHGP